MNYQFTLPNCIHGKAGVYALSCEQAGMYEAEKMWVEMYDSERYGFNLTVGGDGCELGSADAERKRREKITAALQTDSARARTGSWSREFHAENKDKMRDVLRENATRGWAKKSAAERSALRKASWAKVSKEQRAEISKRAWETRRRRQDGCA